MGGISGGNGTSDKDGFGWTFKRGLRTLLGSPPSSLLGIACAEVFKDWVAEKIGGHI